MHIYKKSLFALMAAVLLAVMHSPQAYASSNGFKDERKVLTEKWERMRVSGSTREQGVLVREILTLKDPSTVMASLDWLLAVIKADETSYVYPFIYASQLHRTNYLTNSTQTKIGALGMAYYSKLLLRTDAARCDDRGVGFNLSVSLSRKLAPVMKATQTLKAKEKEAAMDFALRSEDEHKVRKKQPAICRSGAGYMAKALGNKNTKAVETIAKKGNPQGNPPGMKIVTITPNMSIEIPYISDTKWNEKRAKIRKTYQKSIKKVNR